MRHVSERLQAAGIETATAEARRLVCEALAIDAVALIRDPGIELNETQADNVSHWLQRREQGEPLARIRGWQEFYGRRFMLSDATLEPRADTETVISAALTMADASHGRDYPWRILDVGTGTGCIAITLLAELQHATAMATDISAQAIHTAERNAEKLGVAARFASNVTNLIDGVALDYDLIRFQSALYQNPVTLPDYRWKLRASIRLLLWMAASSGLDCYQQLGRQLSKSGWGRPSDCRNCG